MSADRHHQSGLWMVQLPTGEALPAVVSAMMQGMLMCTSALALAQRREHELHERVQRTAGAASAAHSEPLLIYLYL